MSYVPIWTERLVQRLRNLINWRGETLSPPQAMPVIVLNDDLTDKVKTVNTERTTTGTTALKTTKTGRTQTYVTGFILTLSEGQAP